MSNLIGDLKNRSELFLKTDVGYIARGGSWLVVSQIVGGLTGLVSLYFFTSLLPKDVLGTYRYVLSFLSIFSVLTLPGLNGALTQAIARGVEGGVVRVFKLRLKWGVLATTATLALSVYYYINENLVLSSSFLIMALFIPFMNSFYVYRAILSGKEMFREISIYESSTRILSLVVMSWSLFFTSNVVLLILIYFLHYFVIRGLIFFWVNKKLIFNQTEDSATVGFGKHLSLMSIVGTVAAQIDKILIFHFLGASSLAVYTVALAPVDQIKGLVGNLETLAFPKFSNRSDEELKSTLPSKILKLELLIVPMIILYVLLIPFVFKIFFPEYLEAIIFTQIFSVILIFAPRSLITAALGAKMKTRQLYFVRVLGPFFRIITMLIFVSKFGLLGAILGGIFAELILYIIYFKAFSSM